MCFKRIRTSYIWTTLCPELHITTSEQTRHLGVIDVIDHKNTIAILHALVKILGDFSQNTQDNFTRTSVRSMRLQFKVIGHCIAEYIRCLYAFDALQS